MYGLSLWIIKLLFISHFQRDLKIQCTVKWLNEILIKSIAVFDLVYS